MCFLGGFRGKGRFHVSLLVQLVARMLHELLQPRLAAAFYSASVQHIVYLGPQHSTYIEVVSLAHPAFC